MFGYVRPLKSELRVREYEAFRGAYCGLCRALKKNFGAAARYTVNYDMTFAAMLLSQGSVCWEFKRCPASPLRRRCQCGDPALDTAAAISVILAWYKLLDDGEDGGFFKAVTAWGGRVLLRRAWKKAARMLPEFDAAVKKNLAALAALEREQCSSLDKAADTFASLLQSISAQAEGDRARVLSQLFYHLGRAIYILDAADDLAEDAAQSRYNPLIHRFSLAGGSLGGMELESVRLTLTHSVNCVGSAFELLDATPWTPILENIIYLGLPWAADKVLAGEWAAIKKKSHRSE